jgi:hypothetical protein
MKSESFMCLLTSSSARGRRRVAINARPIVADAVSVQRLSDLVGVRDHHRHENGVNDAVPRLGLDFKPIEAGEAGGGDARADQRLRRRDDGAVLRPHPRVGESARIAAHLEGEVKALVGQHHLHAHLTAAPEDRWRCRYGRRARFARKGRREQHVGGMQDEHDGPEERQRTEQQRPPTGPPSAVGGLAGIGHC